MCRYAFNNYKQTWACFSCRKSFKKTNLIDYLKQTDELEKYKKLAHSQKKSDKQKAQERLGTTASEMEADYYAKISVCPECDSRMANMGMDFKSPKTTDLKSWTIIEGMYKIGSLYQTCGCEGIGFVPSSASEYVCYLKEKIEIFESRKTEVLEDEELNSYERNERASYWASKIDKVSSELRGT